VTDQPIIDQPIKDVTTADLGETPSFHTILEVWREILRPAQAAKDEHITPQWASRICSKYQQLEFRDMPEFRDRYFDKIAALESILLKVIHTDEESLNQATPEEDAEHNSENYISVLTEWQICVLGWELDWDCTDPAAAAEMAAISEVHTMFFGEVGLTSLLDQINFEFTDIHRDALGLALLNYKEGREGGSE
jgi:hypothetical protein